MYELAWRRSYREKTQKFVIHRPPHLAGELAGGQNLCHLPQSKPLEDERCAITVQAVIDYGVSCLAETLN